MAVQRNLFQGLNIWVEEEKQEKIKFLNVAYNREQTAGY